MGAMFTIEICFIKYSFHFRENIVKIILFLSIVCFYDLKFSLFCFSVLYLIDMIGQELIDLTMM